MYLQGAIFGEPYKNISERACFHSCKCATMLIMQCYSPKFTEQLFYRIFSDVYHAMAYSSSGVLYLFNAGGNKRTYILKTHLQVLVGGLLKYVWPFVAIRHWRIKRCFGGFWEIIRQNQKHQLLFQKIVLKIFKNKRFTFGYPHWNKPLALISTSL